MATPVLESLVMLLLPVFAVQTLPERSMARHCGAAMPPPVYPVDGEMAAPVGENSSTLLPSQLATHAFPEASMEMPKPELLLLKPAPVKTIGKVKSVG